MKKVAILIISIIGISFVLIQDDVEITDFGYGGLFSGKEIDFHYIGGISQASWENKERLKGITDMGRQYDRIRLFKHIIFVIILFGGIYGLFISLSKPLKKILNSIVKLLN